MAQAVKRRRRKSVPVAPPADRLALTAEEAAHVLGCSVTTVWKLLRTEQLPRMRVGRATRVPRRAVEDFVTAGGVGQIAARTTKSDSSARRPAVGQ